MSRPVYPRALYPRMEFHLARRARDRYAFDEALHALSGAVLLSDFSAARRFADKINRQREARAQHEAAVRAGDLYAIGLIDELAHLLIREYRHRVAPAVFGEALSWLERKPGRDALHATLRCFAEDYPVLAVYQGELGAADYLEAATGGVPHSHAVLEETVLLWLANQNAACAPFREIFDDAPLVSVSHYQEVMQRLHAFFAEQEGFGPDKTPLLELLRAPALASPDSLHGQLELIREAWAPLLGEGGAHAVTRLLRSQDFLKEEAKQRFLGGPGPVQVLDREALAGLRMEGPGGFVAGRWQDGGHGGPGRASPGLLDPASLKEPEYERFSADLSWMPRLVVMAKSTYVWLGQLSERYGRDIYRLDGVPDEELDALAAQGFTGLWLIGLWERSHASKVIKQLMGNADAVASAYSLYDYAIAEDLGGDEAYSNLKERAWRRGIRLASDMVPNHVGIDGRWVIEHPDWFVSVSEAPFLSYRFSGPDLSRDERVGIFLEDHYYDHSDAAVVFKRLDRHTGQARYIYHGNDGTAMAWNDTAQLDYLKAEVREAVIQTILHVARKFSVIRFDAAMTLAKQHIQRLWYPHPGTGGDIASRAEHGLTKAEFNRLMPVEFWREVVDRVAQEVPDTLLLAEAFWMMEGYFVRTLGMHRVYNSAFMHMFKKEDNDQYRELIKNTLEFDPEILKRYVNFMNNPDEETAAEQFGKGDKYFGVCTVMSTLPGLPMFGHGQLEGLFEKYGMEYRRAKWQETPDEGLLRRHEREISPLLHKRYLFAEVENFRLYDFYSGGSVNENVFAYSNRAGDERALVVFNNKYAEARGWIHTSCAFVIKGDGGKTLHQRTLDEGLALGGDERFIVYRDSISGLEFLRSVGALRREGLYLELGAFEYRVFLDFREVEGEDYARLLERLNGRGVGSVEEARRALELEPLTQAFRALASGERYARLVAAWQEARREASSASEREAPAGAAEPAGAPENEGVERVFESDRALPGDVQRFVEQVALAAERPAGTPAAALGAELRALLERAVQLGTSLGGGEDKGSGAQEGATSLPRALFVGALNLVFLKVAQPLAEGGAQAESDAWIDHWQLGAALEQAARGAGADEGESWRALAYSRLLLRHGAAFEQAQAAEDSKAGARALLGALLGDPLARALLAVNHYQGEDYFNQEAFGSLLLALLALPQLVALPGDALARAALLAELRAAEAASGYRLAGLEAYVAEAPASDSGADAPAQAASHEPAATPSAATPSAEAPTEDSSGAVEPEAVPPGTDEDPSPER